MRIVDGARLLRTSFDLVRHDRGLLWFPVTSTCCFLLTAAFWLYEGTWLYSVHGPWVLFVPLVLLGMYSVTFVGIFFSVALAGAANGVLDGRGASFGEGLDVAWSRLASIAGWAAYALSVSLALSLVQRLNRWAGTAAQIAWSFATFFVVPLIAFEGLAAGDARRRSFELAKLNWRAESGGLGALHAAMFVPALVFFVAYKALAGGEVHSPAAQGLLGLALAASLVVGIVAQVVRQVFAVWLYRTATS
jgi:Family of unknown function (DUF6159)